MAVESGVNEYWNPNDADDPYVYYQDFYRKYNISQCSRINENWIWEKLGDTTLSHIRRKISPYVSKHFAVTHLPNPDNGCYYATILFSHPEDYHLVRLIYG